MQHPCEVKYPAQTSTWKKLDEEQYQLHLQKNLDYSPANINYMGMPGVIVRLWDKYCRLLNLFGVPLPNFNKVILDGKDRLKERLDLASHPLTEKDVELIKIIDEEFEKMIAESIINFEKISEKVPANETVEDTIKDLGNYARIAHLVYRKVWGR
jgi:hypothetical protein